MADDQKPKTMDISDLVRELSKSSTSTVTPPRPTGVQTPMSQASRPSFPTQKPMTPPPAAAVPPMSKPPVTTPVPPKPLEMPQPKFTAPPPLSPKPAPAPSAPSPPSPSPTPGVKEYQSSIRTMNKDISNIKQGQKPMGIDVPRKVEQAPVAPQSMPVKPNPPAGGLNQQFRVPSVNLGGTQKAAPIAPPKDIARAPSAPKVEPPPQIYIPEGGQKGGNRKILFIGVGAVVMVAGFSYWFFVLRSPVPGVVIESPIPTPTQTPTLDLSSIFIGLESQTVCTVVCTIDEFISNTNSGTINGGQFKKVYLSENDISDTMTEVLDFLGIMYSPQLKESLGSDSFVLMYGQKEIFDSKGQIKTDAVVEKRLVFINEVKDTSITIQLAKDWEVSMSIDLKSLFQFDPKKQQSKDFTDNSYHNVDIRYKNFKYSDRSIDYAIVASSNGKSYLVLTGSRESMYATIDKLNGF